MRLFLEIVDKGGSIEDNLWKYKRYLQESTLHYTVEDITERWIFYYKENSEE